MSAGGLRLRDLDPRSEAEVDLVARRMRQTLVEVLGAERGEAMYELDWLRERVRYHLGDARRAARVVLAEQGGSILGHAMARVEQSPDEGGTYGHFSTIFVEGEHRGRGVAGALIDEVERWLGDQGVPRITYDTGAHHHRVIGMFERRGYRIARREGEMVRLTLGLGPEGRRPPEKPVRD